ncbi:MAG: hypothetical protein ACKO5A_08110 [Actinomycetota bacterium]
MAVMVGGIGLAVNVTVGLWARATVEAVAYDSARRIAERPAGVDPGQHARDTLANARRNLGPMGATVEFGVVDAGGDSVGVRVRYPGVRLVPQLLRSGPVVGAVDRTITLHREGLR